MSKYTTEVRYICETYAGKEESAGYNDINDIVYRAANKIFENFPIYDEAYRLTLERKILRHYYTREIGFETVSLWLLHLNNRMYEIMPIYNKMYKAATIEFNPFYDVDVTRTRKGNVDTGVAEGETVGSVGTSTNNTESSAHSSSSSHAETNTESTNENNSINKYADTPQGGLEGLRNDSYMSSAQMDEGESTDRGNTETDGNSVQNTSESINRETTTGTDTNRELNRNVETTEEYVEHIVGKQGGVSYSKLWKEYVDNLINIDLRIINELADLFMNVW